MATTATDVVTRDDLESLYEAKAALAFFAERGIAVDDDEADGIRSLAIIDDKNRFIGIPFLILSWRFHEKGKNDTGFVSAEIITEDNRVLVLNDGGTGIFAQLVKLTEARKANGHPTPQAGRMVRKGLNRSDYTFIDEKGKEQAGTTYYLAY